MLLLLPVSFCIAELIALVSSGTIRERVTISCHHPEVFPGRTVMPMVDFLPPHSWVHQEYLHPPFPTILSLVLSTSGRAAQHLAWDGLQDSSLSPSVLR